MELFPTLMSTIPLFALPSGLEMIACSRQEGRLCVSLLSTQPTSHCPVCGSAATRIHSRYQRRLADLPSTGQPVRFVLAVRKFFYDVPTCPRKIFAERLAPFVAPWARVTARLFQMVQIIGLATGIWTAYAATIGIGWQHAGTVPGNVNNAPQQYITLAGTFVGSWPGSALIVFVLTSNFASSFAMHQAMVRYLYAPGIADGTYWQQTSGIVSFGWLASMVTMCIILVYLLTNLAAPVCAHRRHELRVFAYVIAPSLSSLLLLLPPGPIGAYFTAPGFAPTPFPANILPLCVLAWVFAGGGYTVYLSRRHPQRLRQMGQGAAQEETEVGKARRKNANEHGWAR